MPDKPWLTLTEAARLLGVHFTTLRRWADAGQLEFIRTPGGKRRFKTEALAAFVESRQRGPSSTDLALTYQALGQAGRPHPGTDRSSIPWMARMTDAQRVYLRGTGNRLMALLMQYSSRETGNELYLEEGRKISREYGDICFQVGMSIEEAVEAFLMFRRPILEAVHETGALNGFGDPESVRIYQKTMTYLDDILTAMVGQYTSHQHPTQS